MSATPERGSSSSFPWGLLLLIAVAVLLWQLWNGQQFQHVTDILPLPELEASGWLNSEKPVTTAELRGQVVLVDFWASWCGPCKAKMPALVKFHEQYRDRGVAVIGMTPDDGPALADTVAFMKKTEGFTWPVGYGAQPTMDVLDVRALPTLFVVNRQGQIVWRGHDLNGAEQAVIDLLTSS